MMHHPNMHHQSMSGHPQQHMPTHQGMQGHHQHQMPHQLHRENRHVTLTRVPLGAGQGAMGAHTHGQMGSLGALPVHHQRPPHQIRPMPHHPPAQHHSVPPQQMKPMRRQYLGGGYAAGAPPAYPQPEHDNAPRHHVVPQPQHITGLRRPTSPSLVKSFNTVLSAPAKLSSDFVVPPTPLVAPVDTNAAGDASQPAVSGAEAEERAIASDDASRGPANSKEKTPMCLVNELARFNKIKHQYRLTSETGPAHKKVFTVTLRLGDTEEYTAEGSSIKRAQHAAAGAALAGTGFPPPPPRAPHAHAHAPHHAHHRHNGAVMPTVELNALAMKLCQPAVYSSVPPAPAPGPPRPRRPPHFRLPVLCHPRGMSPPVPVPVPHPLMYRVRVMVGGRAWLGEGGTPQAARHDAAARALGDLRPKPQPQLSAAQAAQAAPTDGDTNGETEAELLNSEVKSPVSLVHELALKRNLSVQFSVKSERGPPHMRVFITVCTVGEIETEGEGNGKKVSKRRAAERMLEEMRRRWPCNLLRARPNAERRKPQPVKKKPRNLIKEGSIPCAESVGADNPISRLAVARHAARARSPQYRVVEERGAARRREFLVQCDAPPHSATGHGPNKKTAKRRAAHNVLLAMEMASNGENGAAVPLTVPEPTNGSADGTKSNNDTKRKEGEIAGGASSDVRQPVPGVLMMDYHQRTGQPTQPNGVSETSAVGGAGGNSPGSKDQLMYLSQLLGFTVQFSDFPKRNHGEYLSLVSLSTVPPVMCHGGGPSTAHSHEQCARAALRALELMGLDADTDATNNTIQSVPGAVSKPGVVTGVAE